METILTESICAARSWKTAVILRGRLILNAPKPEPDIVSIGLGVFFTVRYQRNTRKGLRRLSSATTVCT